MRFVVLGAAGRTGRQVVEQALADGHDVVAVARKAEGIPAGARPAVGDATNIADLVTAFDGADAVISTLGGTEAALISRSTDAITEAARTTGIKRVTVMSSFAVQRDRLALPVKLMTSLTMGKTIKDKAAGEAELKASNLDWTIVYPTMLIDDPRSNTAHPIADGAKVGPKDKISRADVAAWLIRATVSDEYRRRTLLITG